MVPKNNSEESILKNNLIGSLNDIRRNGYSWQTISRVLSIEKDDSDFVKALIIKFIQHYVNNGVDSDILLMAFCLLKGYEDEGSIGERRDKYLLESNYIQKRCKDLYSKSISGVEELRTEALRRAALRLPKKESQLIDKFVDSVISNIKELPNLIMEVSKPPVYPSPSYSDKDESCLAVSVQSINNLTPDAPRWDDNHILGRDDFVDSLCQDLLVGTPQLQLTGMGGIGKTETLQKVYLNFVNNKIQHYFAHVGLLKFDGDMDSNLAQQIKYAGDVSAKSVWKYLQTESDNTNMLLLIDDIRSPKISKSKPDKTDETNKADNPFEKLISLNVTVLLASRTLQKKFENRPVNPLSMEQCVQIFTDQLSEGEINATPSSLKQEDINQLETIIRDRAGFNTLIVNRLGAMARDNGLTISMLSDRLESAGFSISKGNGDDIDDDELIQDEINKLYKIEDIQHPVALNILEAFALFPNIPLEQETCVQWLKEDAGIDEDRCRRALMKLSKQTWLTFHKSEEADTCSFIMHQLVKSAINAQVNISFYRHTKLIDHCYNAVDFVSKNVKGFLAIQQYIAFAASIVSYFHDEQRAEIAALINRFGRYFEEKGEYGRALDWKHKALSIREQILEPEHPDIATSYHDIARIHERKKDYAVALEWYYKALAIREKVLGCDHPDTADTYHRIGFVFYWENNPEALKWYKKALKIRENVLGTEHLTTAVSYRCIADAYFFNDEEAQALDWYYKALKVYETKSDMGDNDYLEYAEVCSGISHVYASKGQVDEMNKWQDKRREVFMKGSVDRKTVSAIYKKYTAKSESILDQCEDRLALNKQI